MQDLLSSLLRVSIGCTCGVLFGILLASIRFSLPTRLQNNPLVIFIFEFMRFPPPIAWLPIVIIFFGISPLSSIFIVFLATFPIVQTNIYDGLFLIPKNIQRMALSLELSRFFKIKSIYIPMILPQVFTGIRLGLGMGWMSIIAAEMVGGQEGLGYSIQAHRVYLQNIEVLKDIFYIGLVGFIFHFSLKKIEQKMTPWAHIQDEK